MSTREKMEYVHLYTINASHSKTRTLSSSILWSISTLPNVSAYRYGSNTICHCSQHIYSHWRLGFSRFCFIISVHSSSIFAIIFANAILAHRSAQLMGLFCSFGIERTGNGGAEREKGNYRFRAFINCWLICTL